MAETSPLRRRMIEDMTVRNLSPATQRSYDDVENLSQIWAVAPALVKLALRDVQPSQKDKEPPWKRIAKGRRWAM